VCVAAKARACSLTYSACNAPPYCHLRPLWFHHILRHYFINVTIFGTKETTEHKMRVLIFSTIFIWNISHSKKNSARYCHKCRNVFMKSTRCSGQSSSKPEFSRRIFLKSLKSNLIKIRPVWAELFHAGGRTVGHDRAKSLVAILRTRLKCINVLGDYVHK
jgi:hypothetical protein